MIQPLRDGVVVIPEPAAKESDGGIILASVVKTKYLIGEVVAVGRGRMLEDGTINRMEVKIGDQVVFAAEAGRKIEGTDQVLMCEFEILAVVEEK